MNRAKKALIVGGGVAGSVAAMALQRAGMDSVFGLHHFAHAHNAEVSSDPLGGLEAKGMAAKNKEQASND